MWGEKERVMQDFRNLKVWERAHELTLEIYRLTGAFPKTEVYGLVTQMRRACVSIGATSLRVADVRETSSYEDFCQSPWGRSANCHTSCW